MSRIASLVQYIPKRNIFLSAPREGKRQFDKIMLYNKRGTRAEKKERAKDPSKSLLAIDKRNCRDVGDTMNGLFYVVPERIPELIVPDLKDCNLKPYVSYRAPDVHQSKFTAEQLFEVVYAEKITKDFKEGKLDENGSPLEPSSEEKLTPEEAYVKARQTGSDLFEKQWEEWRQEIDERLDKEFDKFCYEINNNLRTR